jgi:peptidoglycan/LPS O-acetylase OafA/YrhL
MPLIRAALTGLAKIGRVPTALRRVVSSNLYKPEIDGLRFFAISMVVIGHLLGRVGRQMEAVSSASSTYDPTSGVYLFFAISGFVIASQFLRKKLAPLSGAFLGPYFLRRLTRIEPPYLLLIILSYLFLITTNYRPPGMRQFYDAHVSLTESFIASLFYSHGWLIGAQPKLFLPGWSLEIEVQFYLIAPFLFYLFFALIKGAARQALGVSLLVVLAGVSQLPVFRYSAHLYYTLPHFLVYFWLGIVLADINARHSAFFRRLPPRILAAAAWVSVPLFQLTFSHPSPDFLVETGLQCVAIFFISVIFAGALGRGSFHDFCANRWISLVGGACYSIYLTHLQFLQVATPLVHKLIGRHFEPSWYFALVADAAFLIPCVLLIGVLFYAFVERPFMNPNWFGEMRGKIHRLFRRPALRNDEV